MKKIPWWTPQIGPGELGLVQQVLESGYVNEGEVAERFERTIADFVGARHGIATTSGTVAIFMSLAALGIGHGDEVVVPDITFIATANAVSLTGATPVLVDVDPRTLNLDPTAFERAITSRTRAVVPVHVTGRPADMEAINGIAKSRDLLVVEDAAEALGCRHHGRSLGTWGRTGCFSFSPNKTITCGQGGMIVTDDSDLAGKLRALKDQGRPVRGTGGDDLHPTLGFNFKLTNLQAAVGLGQYNYLHDRLARQKRIYDLYAEGLRDVRGVRVFACDTANGACPQWTDIDCDRRDELEAFLASKGASCRKFWHPLHTQKPYLQSDAGFPHAIEGSRRALWLPSAFTLSDDDVRSVIGWIREFYGKDKQ